MTVAQKSNDLIPFEFEVEDEETGEFKLLYRSQERQTLFHTAVLEAYERRGPRFLLYGGAAGGGKTEALLWAILGIAQDTRFKNIKIAVFRKTFPEIEKFFILRALENYPSDEYRYTQKDHSMKFHKTGATVWFNYCENEADVIKYQGAEFDVLVFDEITHHTEYVYTYLRTRMRTSTPGFTPILIATTNPGGVGHQWVKRLWVDRDDYNDGERMVHQNGEWIMRSMEQTAKNYLFIPAKVWDNQALIKNDPNYVTSLMALPEMDKRALLEGDWNIFAGQYFGEIRRDVHAFDPLTFGMIPHTWTRFIAMDYGFFPHPASVGWYAVDENGWLYRYKELLVQRHTTSQLAKKIIEMTTLEERRLIDYVVIPPDLWAKRGNAEGRSGAEEMIDVFDEEGWLVVKADNDRVNGWYQVRERLKPFDVRDGKKKKTYAQFYAATTCSNWWKQMPMLQHDPNRPEDVFKAGVTADGKIWEGDDVGDEVRYAVMSRYSPAKRAKREPRRDRYGAKVRSSSMGVSYQKPDIKYKAPKYRGYERK